MRPVHVTSGPARRPPAIAPTGKPAMMRGIVALMPAMSRTRPACIPTKTNPSSMRIAKTTSRGPETHAPPPPPATSQAAAKVAVIAPRTATATGTRSNRRDAAAIPADTATPAPPTTMYVTGSHPEP